MPPNESAYAHVANKNWAQWTANKFALLHSSLPAEALYVACSTFQASYALYSPYSPVFLPFGCPYNIIGKDCELVNLIVDKNFALHMSISAYSSALCRYIGCAHTSCTHVDRISELMSSLITYSGKFWRALNLANRSSECNWRIFYLVIARASA